MPRFAPFTHRRAPACALTLAALAGALALAAPAAAEPFAPPAYGLVPPLPAAPAGFDVSNTAPPYEQAYSSAMGSCPAGSTATLTGTAAAAAQGDGFVKVSSAGPVSVDGETLANGTGGSAVVWRAAPAVGAGASPSLPLACDPSTTGGAAVEWWPRHGLELQPSNFDGYNGASTDLQSDIGWTATYAREYYVYVFATGGPVTVTANGHSRTFPAGANGGPENEMDIGMFSRGQAIDAHIDAAGAETSWRVVLAVSGQSAAAQNGLLSSRSASSHLPLAVSWDAIADTRIGAVVTRPDGSVARTIIAPQLVAPGHHEATWDGSDDGGRPLPDGNYWLWMLTDRPLEGGGHYAYGVTIDNTAPSITRSAAPATTGDPLFVPAHDGLTGVSGGQVEIDGRTTPSVAQPGGLMASPPPGGWVRGRAYKYSATVRDAIGNDATTDGTFTIAAAAVRCSKLPGTRSVSVSGIACGKVTKALRHWWRTSGHKRSSRVMGLRCRASRIRVSCRGTLHGTKVTVTVRR